MRTIYISHARISFFHFIHTHSLTFIHTQKQQHYRNEDYLKLLPGMIFTIEPMLVEGSPDCFEWKDEWTVATVDHGLAAQFEHTVMITETGVEILTVMPDDE